MDISVSRLNNRMVMQVPPELPLGLVFVVGQVHNLNETIENAQPLQFDLVEAGYRLRCQVSSRVANDVFLQEGDIVRAGGHLAFDTQAARYFLLARDLEIVPDIAGTRTKMAPILADIKRRAEAAELVRTELPQWVKQLAPPEVQEELGLIEAEGMADDMVPQAADTLEPGTDLLAPVVDMSDEMLTFLSEAMDRNEDVEVTPEVLAQFIPLEGQPGGSSGPPAEQTSAPKPAPRPPMVTSTDLSEPTRPESTASQTTRPVAATQPAAATKPAAAAQSAVAKPAPPPEQPKRNNNNTVQTLLLGTIAILFLLLLIVVSLIALNFLTG